MEEVSNCQTRKWETRDTSSNRIWANNLFPFLSIRNMLAQITEKYFLSYTFQTLPFLSNTVLLLNGSVCKVRTQDPENFDEEVKSLVTAWLMLTTSSSMCYDSRKLSFGDVRSCRNTVSSWVSRPLSTIWFLFYRRFRRLERWSTDMGAAVRHFHFLVRQQLQVLKTHSISSHGLSSRTTSLGLRKVHGRLKASWKISCLAVNGQSFLVIDGYLLNPTIDCQLVTDCNDSKEKRCWGSCRYNRLPVVHLLLTGGQLTDIQRHSPASWRLGNREREMRQEAVRLWKLHITFFVTICRPMLQTHLVTEKTLVGSLKQLVCDSVTVTSCTRQPPTSSLFLTFLLSRYKGCRVTSQEIVYFCRLAV